MTDHRNLQRTLFRMQVDSAFCRSVLAGDEAALGSTGLGRHERSLLATVDARGVLADPGGKRRLQVLGNAASEYAVTLVAAAAKQGESGFLNHFGTSPEFHDALRSERGLPLAFGDYAVRCAREENDPLLGALGALELALVRLRRSAVEDPRPGPGELVLSGSARVVEFPRGTHRAATVFREALDRGTAPERPHFPGAPTEKERLLLLAAERSSPFRLREVHVEALDPPTDELFARLAEGPLGSPERERFARAQGADPADLDGFLHAFVEDGALLFG